MGESQHVVENRELESFPKLVFCGPFLCAYKAGSYLVTVYTYGMRYITITIVRLRLFLDLLHQLKSQKSEPSTVYCST